MYTLNLTSDQTAAVLSQALSQATAISNAGSATTVGSNTFVFFAAFDGTDNGADPQTDGSHDSQNTAIAQLAKQVGTSTNVTANYYPGVGTPSTLPGSDGTNPLNLNEQIVATAQKAYNDFATEAHAWLINHPGGSLTSMITSFSRGDGSAAVFAQMLYENGLVYTDSKTGDKTTLIPPGQIGSNSPISAALILDPVVTEVTGNLDFPPNIQNFTVIQAENEYRTAFEAANYMNDGATVYQVPGNHGDVGDLYDNGLGGIYLGAYTNFFKNAGLNIAAVDPSRAYSSGNPILIHSENDPSGPLYDRLFYNTGSNDISTARRTVTDGSPVGTAPNGLGTEFTTKSGDDVIGGTGGIYTTEGDHFKEEDGSVVFTRQNYAVLPNAQVTINGGYDAITVNQGATLTFNSTDVDANTVLPANVITLDNNTTLNISGINTVVNVDDPEAVTINKATGAKYTVHIEDGIHNDLNYDPVSTTFNTDANGNVVFTAQSPNGSQEDITVSDTSDNDTITAGGVTTTISNMGYVSYDTNGNIVLNQDSDSATPASDSNPVTVTYTVGGTTTTETVNAANDDLTTDTLTFEGQSIAGDHNSSTADAYGRTYALDNGTLTITDGSDSMTINNFSTGDFGVDIGYALSSISLPNWTGAISINGSGEIAGSYYDFSGNEYIFTDINGSITSTTLPGYPTGFYNVAGITDGGTIFGSITPQHPGEQFRYFAINGGSVSFSGTPFANVNSLGESIINGDQLDNNGTITIINDPNGPVQNAFINNAGLIAGTYFSNSDNAYHGFIDNGGVFTTLDDPNGGGTERTSITGINDEGSITGLYEDGASHVHGFVYNNGLFTTVGAPGTIVTGINDSGTLAGYHLGGGDFLATLAQSITESNSTTNVADNTDEQIYGSGNAITAGSNDTVTVDGNNNAVTAGTGSDELLYGANDTITAADGDTVTVSGDGQVADTAAYDTVNLSNGTVEADDATSFTLNGSRDSLNAGNDDNITVNGANNTITAGAGDNIVLSGNNTVNASANVDLTTDTLTFDRQSIASTLTFDSAGSVVSSGMTYTPGGTDTMTIASGSDSLTIDNFQGGDFGITIAYNYMTTNGTDTIVSASTATVTGDGNTINAGSNDTVTVAGNNNATTLGGSANTVSVTGAGNTIISGTGNTISIAGNGQVTDPTLVDTLNASSDTINVADNTSAIINGSGNTIIDANDNITINGNNNTLAAGAGDNIAVSGNGNVITAASGDTINIAANSHVTLNGDNLVINPSAGDNVTINSGTGSSQQELVAPSADISVQILNYTGANLTGTLTSELINYTAGNSEQKLFTNLASGESEEDFNYTAANATGTLTSELIKYTDGSHATKVFNPSTGVASDTKVYSASLNGKLLFSGIDASNNNSLWVTDGTSGGTTELTSGLNVNPNSITVIGNDAVFTGTDANGYSQIWGTDGTTAGTMPLTTAATNRYPYDITVSGNKAFFGSNDANGTEQLWITDGTAAGTLQLTSGANLSPNDITALGNIAMFEGLDSSGQAGQLWVTDGTAAGTVQLTSGANLNPNDITVLGDRAVFAGSDASGNGQLWVTDGTAAGTIQLTSGSSVSPNNITKMGNVALFSGNDAGGNSQLWVTDGTVAGTTELTTGSSLYPSRLTVLGNKAVFSGYDSSGNNELWVTDGTTAGTQELTSIANGLYPSFITAIGNKAVFSGHGANGNTGLWVTDGTVTGTQELTTSAYPATHGRGSADQIISVGNKAFFTSFDSNLGAIELWVTDGTATGTQELTTVTGISPGNLTAFGNSAIFSGVDTSGNNQLWITDGTIVGTQELTVANAASFGINPSDLTDFIGSHPGHLMSETINYTNGSSVGEVFTYNSDGSSSEVITAYSGEDLTGTQEYQQTTNTSAHGQTSIIVSGTGDVIQEATGANLTTDTLAFDGNVVTGSQSTGAADGYGRKYALDSSNNLTITDGSNTLTIDNFVNGDFGLTVSSIPTYTESNSAITIGDNAAAIVNGSGNTITAGNNDTLTVNGDGNFTTAGSGSIVTADGDGNTITAADGDTVNIAAQHDAVHMNNGTVHVTAASDFNLNGDGDTVTSASNVSVAVIGNNDSLSLSGSNNILTIEGTSDHVNISGSGTTVASAVSTLLSNGVLSMTFSHALINVNAGDSSVITGTDGVLTAINAVGSSTNVTTTIDWNTGGSQVQLLTNLPTGVTSRVRNYTGAGGTGTLTSEIFELTDGTSKEVLFTNLPTGVSKEVLFYSGANLTGALTRRITDFTVGNSTVEIFNQSSTILSNTKYYSGLDGTGTLNSQTIDYTDGTSRQNRFTGLAAGVSEIDSFYSGADLSGNLTKQITDFTAGNSTVKVFNQSSTILSNTKYYTGPDGSGTLTSQTIDYTDGTSKQILYTGLPTGVSEEDINYSGADLTGMVTSTNFIGTSGNDTLTATATKQILTGNGGYDMYQFGRGDGADTIRNGLSTNTGPTGELDLGANIARNQLWFEQKGNNLQVDILGTHDHMTVANWYGTPTSQLSEIKTSDGYMIDTQLAQLVQAMATYSASHTAFNPTTATTMPNDPTLQSTLAASWHS